MITFMLNFNPASTATTEEKCNGQQCDVQKDKALLKSCFQCDQSYAVAVVQTASKLRGILPVVVDANVWEDAGEALDDTFIPDAEVW